MIALRADLAADSDILARQEYTHSELSPETRAELLDPKGWANVLETYARTMHVAVALTDVEGRLLGACHNPQPVWRLARDAARETGTQCSFCLISHPPCNAVAESLKTRNVVMVRDQSGLAHIAVPLSLGDQQLGALIAGQVFDRYPEPLPLQRVAKEFGISPQELWRSAIHRAPVRRATLQVYGDLLGVLGAAFLRQRYSVIIGEKLAEMDRRYRLLIDSAKDYAFFTVDTAGRVTSWNRGAEHLYGYTEAEIMGRDFSCLFTPEEVQAGEPKKLLQKATRAGSVQDEGWHARKDGTRFFASGLLTSLGEPGSSELGRLTRDITEHRQSEQALRQSQRLESVGLLAGGIAHDFNNLLAGILFSVSCARTTILPDDPASAMLEIAEQSTQKAAALTSQLLAYAGKGKFVVSRFDFSLLISEMLPLINSSISKDVHLQLALPRDLLWIEADASQIQQVVMNLVINGAEAMGDAGGTLRICSGALDTDAADPSAPGRSVYMEVQDSGCGMSEAVKARIFDPFYTTKFSGRGLGLAAVSGIIRGHHGRMEVDSVPGEGTTFRVFLPLTEAPLSMSQELSLASAPRGTGVILFADDEPVLRGLVKVILERCGYSVLIAENGLDAVSLFRENAGEIAAVVLDLTMPVMGGEEALSQIREVRADVPVIISSGYSEFFARKQFLPGDAVSFIQKPYTPAKLAEKLSGLIPQEPHS